jgi:4a-hydroxytetrahydrobiopterin dehydratase
LPSWSKSASSPRAKAITPDISFGWGRATVSLSTKKIKGLHENDFIMASKIDRMADRPGPTTGTPR